MPHVFDMTWNPACAPSTRQNMFECKVGVAALCEARDIVTLSAACVQPQSHGLLHEHGFVPCTRVRKSSQQRRSNFYGKVKVNRNLAALINYRQGLSRTPR